MLERYLPRIEFDSYAGESFYSDKMQRVLDELNEKAFLEAVGK